MQDLEVHLLAKAEVLRAGDGSSAIFRLVQNFGTLLAVVIEEDLKGGDFGGVNSDQIAQKAGELGVPKIVVVGRNGFVGDFEKYTGPRLRGIDEVVNYIYLPEFKATCKSHPHPRHPW